MKVEQIEPKPAFKPVVITLESQQEVDAMYALFNISHFNGVLEPIFGELPYRKVKGLHDDTNADVIYRKMAKHLK